MTIRYVLAAAVLAGLPGLSPLLAFDGAPRIAGNPVLQHDAQEAAIIDARMRLLDAIMALPVPGGIPTGVATAPSTQPAGTLGSIGIIRQLEPSIRAMCRQAELVGRPRIFMDDTLEVDLVLTRDAVRDGLLRRLSPGNDPAGPYLPRTEAVVEMIKALPMPATFTATGIGRAEQMKPTDEVVPAGVAAAPQIPPGWGHVSRTGRLLASRTASADAARRLRGIVFHLPAESGKPISDELAPTSVDALENWITNRGVEGTSYDPDGVATAHMNISIEELSDVFSKLSGRDGKPAAVKKLAAPLAIEGYAFAPDEPATATRPVGVRTVMELPDWAAKPLTVAGRSELTETQRALPDADARARYQADVNARIALVEKLSALKVADGVPFGQVLALFDQSKRDLDVYIAGVPVVSEKTLAPGVVEVTLQANLERIHRIAVFHLKR